MLLLTLVVGLVISNLFFKKEFDNPSLENEYPGFSTLNSNGFKHLHLNTGGKAGKIIFESSEKSRFMVATYLDSNQIKLIQTRVSNDTLYINFPDTLIKTLDERGYRYYNVNIRLFSPELRSVWVNDSHLELQKMKQTDYQISLSGKSDLNIETKIPVINLLNVSLADSSSMQVNYNFEESEYAKTPISIENCTAKLSGASRLRMANSKIKNLQLQMNEESSIDLSGYNLKKLISEGNAK